ncbi:MAG: SsrA-binding protein SmpB [Bacteroidia bacterium]
MAKIQKDINIVNRKASFEFSFIEKYVAGMQLTGTEIKSIREGKASLAEGYCFLLKGELWTRGIHISEYTEGTVYNHNPTRERKLLLSKQELNKLEKKLKDQGLTIIPLRLFIAESGYAKLEIALAKGKKIHDKRDDIKKKDVQREMDRKIK